MMFLVGLFIGIVVGMFAVWWVLMRGDGGINLPW